MLENAVQMGKCQVLTRLCVKFVELKKSQMLANVKPAQLTKFLILTRKHALKVCIYIIQIIPLKMPILLFSNVFSIDNGSLANSS